MKKQIVSETKQYQPSFPDELLLDDTPKVNSFNGVTSDGVARAIAGASGEVPVVTESDNGKVLKAIYDAGGPAVEWGEVESGATYTAGDGIDITSDTISAKVDGSTIRNNAESWKNIGNAELDYILIQDSCDNISSLLIGPSKYDSSTGTWVVDWTSPFWRSEPQNADFLRIDLQSDSTWVLAPGWGVTLDRQPVKLYAASTDGTTMGTPLALPLYSELSTDSSAMIRYDNTNGVTLPRYVYIRLVPAWVETLCACNTLNFGVDNFGSDTTMLTAKPTGASIRTYWTEYVKLTGLLGVSNPLPASAIGDAGKVLTVNNAGSAEWTTPSGGGGSDDVAVLTYGTSTWDDVSAAIAANKHLAVQGNVSLNYYTYKIYSDDMTYDDGITSGSGHPMVSWCVVDPSGTATYRVQLVSNNNWYVESLAELPSTSGTSAGQILSLNNYHQPVWTTPAASGGMKWSRNTQPTVDASNGITATLSGLSVTNSACVVNVSLLIYPSDMFTTNIPSTLTFKVLQNFEYSDYYFGTLTAELSSYQYESRYRACGTVTLPYGNSELSEIVIYDPNGTSLVVSGATYEVSVGVAK